MSANKVWMQKIYPDAILPKRATPGSVGFDVYAYEVIDQNSEKKERLAKLPFTLLPGQRALFGIGVMFATPWPIVCDVRPRSGLSSKNGIDLGNSPGTVDPDYRGQIGILLYNRSDRLFTIEKGDRIAQLLFHPVTIPAVEEVEILPPTKRGLGGFGSTGMREIIGGGDEEFRRQQQKMDIYFMKIAIATAGLSSCARGCRRDDSGRYHRDGAGELVGQTRRFGCIIVNPAGNVIATGYNAQPAGQPLCADIGCLREEKGIPSGKDIETCRAVHAEQMALVKAESSLADTTMYVNAAPCGVCAKMIAGSNMDALVILDGVYPTNGIDIVRASNVDIRILPRELLA